MFTLKTYGLLGRVERDFEKCSLSPTPALVVSCDGGASTSASTLQSKGSSKVVTSSTTEKFKVPENDASVAIDPCVVKPQPSMKSQPCHAPTMDNPRAALPQSTMPKPSFPASPTPAMVGIKRLSRKLKIPRKNKPSSVKKVSGKKQQLLSQFFVPKPSTSSESDGV